MPVKRHDGLGDQVWRVAFDDVEGQPVLELNDKFECIAQMAKTDEVFLALVYPAVVRIVLYAVLRGANHITDLDGPEDDWRYEWLRFASSLPGIVDPPPLAEDLEDESAQADQEEWIAGVVGAFCSRCQTLDGFSRLIELRGLS